MNTTEATTYALGLNLNAIETAGLVGALTAGTLTVCPDCRFTLKPGTYCEVCMEACFEDQAAKYDAAAADRDAFRFDVNEYEFRNFVGEGVN